MFLNYIFFRAPTILIHALSEIKPVFLTLSCTTNSSSTIENVNLLLRGNIILIDYIYIDENSSYDISVMPSFVLGYSILILGSMQEALFRYE